MLKFKERGVKRAGPDGLEPCARKDVLPSAALELIQKGGDRIQAKPYVIKDKTKKGNNVKVLCRYRVLNRAGGWTTAHTAREAHVLLDSLDDPPAPATPQKRSRIITPAETSPLASISGLVPASVFEATIPKTSCSCGAGTVAVVVFCPSDVRNLCCTGMPADHTKYTLSGVASKQLGGALKATWVCTNCRSAVTLQMYGDRKPRRRDALQAEAPSIPKLSLPLTDVSREVVLGHLLSNPSASFVKYVQQMHSMHLTPMSQHTFEEVVEDVARATSAILRSQLTAAHHYIRENHTAEVALSLDGCYLNRGHFSPMMTVDAVCQHTGCIVGLVHVSLHGTVVPDDFSNMVMVWQGSAKSAEAAGTENVIARLQRDGLSPQYVVVDGDASNLSQITAAWPYATAVPCFNHLLKAKRKGLEEAFKTKGSGCLCRSTNHRWTGSGCGCASPAHARHIQALLHTAAVMAKDNREECVKWLQQYPLHLQGDHSSCTFHPKLVCNGTCEPRCSTRGCECGACKPGERRCFGNKASLEPKCPGGGGTVGIQTGPHQVPQGRGASGQVDLGDATWN